MKTVRQQDDNGCGVACVAMLAGITYGEARKQVYLSGRSRLTKTKDLLIALRKLGRQPVTDRRQPFGSKTETDLEHDALVFVELTDEDGDQFKHWMVWDAESRNLRDSYRPKCSHKLRGYVLIK